MTRPTVVISLDLELSWGSFEPRLRRQRAQDGSMDARRRRAESAEPSHPQRSFRYVAIVGAMMRRSAS